MVIKIGDWVTQYSKGFWLIVDIKPKYAEDDCNRNGIVHKKGDQIGSWIVMKKGFTPKMKFRIDSDVCDSAWCKPVSADILELINQYFEKNPDDYQKFVNTPFVDRPAVSTTWLQLTGEQVSLFQKAIQELPELFTQEEALKLFEGYNLKQCFSPPPSNYTFVCEHTLWELDSNFNPLFKNPRLKN